MNIEIVEKPQRYARHGGKSLYRTVWDAMMAAPTNKAISFDLEGRNAESLRTRLYNGAREAGIKVGVSVQDEGRRMTCWRVQ